MRREKVKNPDERSRDYRSGKSLRIADVRSPKFRLGKGEGVYLFDTSGKAYLDFVSGIAVNALGYGDPEVLEAIHEQSKKLIHVSNLYHTIPHAELARSS